MREASRPADAGTFLWREGWALSLRARRGRLCAWAHVRVTGSPCKLPPRTWDVEWALASCHHTACIPASGAPLSWHRPVWDVLSR